MEEVLRAYCLGLIKCCDLVLAMVSSQHYYEVSVTLLAMTDADVD